MVNRSNPMPSSIKENVALRMANQVEKIWDVDLGANIGSERVKYSHIAYFATAMECVKFHLVTSQQIT
ncbi:MAG: hypothetical protein ACJ788_28670 [Ktedonobacteraceae bacterium]